MRALHLAAACLALVIAALPAISRDVAAGELVIEEAWSRATPPGAKVAAGYVRIVNKGDSADRLIGGSIETADRVEIHEMRMEGDVMKMARLENGITIEAGASLSLEPGGNHLMFMGLTQRQTEGMVLRGTLVFEKAGTIEVTFPVKAIGAGADGGHGMHGEGHGMHGSGQ